MASDPATTLTAGPLAPSEMVLLYAERFTTAQILLGRTGDPQVPLLHADMTVSAPQLGRAILAVAILANDRAGTIRLDPRQKTKLFGLSSVDTLFADPLENKVTWPASSLESRVLAVAQRLFDDKEQHEVLTIITELLPMSPEPWATVAGLVIQGLGDRGLLDEAPIGEPDVLSTRQWVLSESTRKIGADQDIGPAEQLLSECERDRPELWNRLNEQIKEAVTQRKEPA